MTLSSLASCDTALAVAAVLYDRSAPVDRLLAAVARELALSGVRVGGLVQHNIRRSADAPCVIDLEDVTSGERYRITQDLGCGSDSCSLDAAMLAEASVAVRNAVAAQAELVIVNKFGTQEATGHGLRDEIGQVVAAGIPLLTAVGDRYLEQWREFTGGEAVLLPASLPAVLEWWAKIRGAADSCSSDALVTSCA